MFYIQYIAGIYKAGSTTLKVLEIRLFRTRHKAVSASCQSSQIKDHHHQPINVPTAEAQAFLMVYT
jgi:hypothetical protein